MAFFDDRVAAISDPDLAFTLDVPSRFRVETLDLKISICYRLDSGNGREFSLIKIFAWPP